MFTYFTLDRLGDSPCRFEFIRKIGGEAYLEPSRISKLKLFAKIDNGFQTYTIFAKRFILDVRLGSEYASEMLVYCILFIQNTLRSSLPEVFCKESVLESFAKFAGKHLCHSIFFNKVTGLSPATYSKRDSGTGVFKLILRNF